MWSKGANPNSTSLPFRRHDSNKLNSTCRGGPFDPPGNLRGLVSGVVPAAILPRVGIPRFARNDGKCGTVHVGTAAIGCPGEQSSPAPQVDNADEAQQKPSRAALGTDSRRRLSPEDQFHPGEFFSALLKQLYIGQPYVPRNLYVPVDFEDREELEELLSDQSAGARASRVHISVPQRGDKRSLIDLAGNNAKQSYDQRFRVLKPNARRIQEELQEVIGLPELPKRIECFDISHIQGAETVASMVVWEDGKMKKSDYRKFIIRTVQGVDDFASMREVVTRRYKRLQDEKKVMPSLVLIDGGLGQLHAAAEALEALEIINQPLAAIAKREEILYVYGQEQDPIALDHHSPVLHLIQMIRDEAHRFAVTFHRKRRQMRDRATELLEIPGVGSSTSRRLLEHFGSVQAVKQADTAALSAVVTRVQAEAIRNHFHK
jgi:excinuclease ABC subunit C